MRKYVVHNQHRRASIEERRAQLWGRCSNTDDPSACWPWQGARVGPENLYGKLSVDGKLVQAHVQAWKLHHGVDVPEGLEVAHGCHNPPCCNPAHLEAMTHRQNEDAKIDAGRTTNGVRNGQARLDDALVLAIRQRRADGATLTLIGEEFGISFQHVSDICRGRRWAHVKEATPCAFG